MTLDFSNPGFWLSLVQSVAIVLLWLRQPGEDAGRDIEKFRVQQVETSNLIKGRVDVLEERVRHMPTTDEVRELEGQMHGIKAELGVLKDAVAATRGGVSRIEHFLLSESRRP
jgi:hypothetical protein